MIEVRSEHQLERQMRLVRTDLPVRFRGTLFETLEIESQASVANVDQMHFQHSGSGFRARNRMPEDDILRLLADINVYGENAHRCLQLGMIQRQINDADQADYFLSRSLLLAAANGDSEAQWRALYELGKHCLDTDRPVDGGHHLANAYDLYPDRLESLYHLVRASCRQDDLETAKALLEVAKDIGFPEGAAYCEWPLYDSPTDRLTREFPRLAVSRLLRPV